MFINYLSVFFISVLCIALELFLTRILNLKAWNHLVYIIIPYAILGYGIGANLCLIFREQLRQCAAPRVLGVLLVLSSVFSMVTALVLIPFPIDLQYILDIFVSIKAVAMLLAAYSILTIPFMLIGFCVVYLFQTNAAQSHRLYFWDLLGAGAGAFLFYPLINSTQVVHSIIILALLGLFLGLVVLYPKYRYISAVFIIFLGWFSLTTLPEPQEYKIDQRKGWEYIPGHFSKEQYRHIVSRWHPLGRTDIFQITDAKARENIYNSSLGTFEINVLPTPEFSYISTNYLAGSPIFALSRKNLAKNKAKVKLFSQAMEFPYVLLNKPKVLVIGTGGGRDIFMAKTHGAPNVIGAEINPGIYKEMSPQGKFHEYSGRVYNLPNVSISNVDGRQLVKRQPSNSRDLIILNGVDTFSGLSSGAYAYAESYLYTTDAVQDYLRVLTDNGMINFNRWYFSGMPREDLRLFAIILDALRQRKVENPGDHVILGVHQTWALFLVKKTPFTPAEKEKVYEYFRAHNVQLAFPSTDEKNFFALYLANFNQKREGFFVDQYPYDVSVITDDKPFFYKYYKLKEFNPSSILAYHHTGTVIFLTQGLVLFQSLVFIVLFILLPLYIFKKKEIQAVPARALEPFLFYFACLGLGFMFIEISLMQRFVLLLGSPIYAISVTLAALLVSSGIGSFLLPRFEAIFKGKDKLVSTMSVILSVLLVLLIVTGMGMLDAFIGLSFIWRVLIVCVMLFPMGVVLGIFFPAGLMLLSRKYSGAIPWAWGINCGFTVLGSILTIIFSQFLGFNFILALSCLVYLMAGEAFKRMHKELAAED